MKSDNNAVQRFRVKLSLYLQEAVVPGLRKKEQEVVVIDQKVFDRLNVGPRLTHSLEATIHAIGDYAREILFYMHSIRTEVITNPKKMSVSFRCLTSEENVNMGTWVPLSAGGVNESVHTQ